MNNTFSYPVPGFGPKNSMAAEDTIEKTITVNKATILEQARAMLHKFGDARLTQDNEYHIHTVQADDLEEDTLLLDRSYDRALKDAQTACTAYLVSDNTANTIHLMMPSTWQEEAYAPLCDNINDFILYSIVADFLKLTEPREYKHYKEEALNYRVYIKDALEMRKPFTRYTEIKPY